MLASSGGGVTGFIGFLPADGAPNATLSGEDDFSLDADFRVMVKKLSKRDGVTKLKALAEMNELIASKTEADLKRLAPYWPRLFAKLAVDYEGRVREATFKTHQIIVQSLGKGKINNFNDHGIDVFSSDSNWPAP